MKKFVYAFIVFTVVSGMLNLWFVACASGQRIGNRGQITDELEIKVFPQLGHTDEINTITFSPDGKFILSGANDTTIKLWDVETGREIKTFAGHTWQVLNAAFTPDGKYIVSDSVDETVRLWDVETGNEIEMLPEQINNANPSILSFDGKTIVTRGNTFILQDAETKQEIRSFSGFTGTVLSAAYSPDMKYFLSNSNNSFVLWDTETGVPVRNFSGHSDSVRSVSFSPDGKQVLSGSRDRTIKLWDLESGQEIKTIFFGDDFINSASFSPDGKYILGSSRIGNIGVNQGSGSVFLFDVDTGRRIRTFSGNHGYIFSAEFSPDGKQIITCARDRTIKLWNVETGREIKTFRGHTGQVQAAVFSPDGKQILSGSNDGTVRLWDIETGQEIRKFTENLEDVLTVAFHPNGKYALSDSVSNTLWLWDIETGQAVKSFKGHTSMVFSFEFSPDGKQIISGSYDGTTRLWDIITGKEIAQFISFTDSEWIVITPDGYYNASPNGDQYLNVRVENQVYGIDQYHEIFYRPDKVEARLAGDLSASRRITIQDITTRIPPSVNIISPEDNTTIQTATANLRLTIEDRNQPIRQVKVFINGRSVGSEEMRSIDGKRDVALHETSIAISGRQKNVNLEFPLRLEPGKNIIEVQAYNGYSWSRRKSVTINNESNQQAALPNLWILAIGVNRYDNQNIRDLNYCVRDAQELINTFKQQEGIRYTKVNSLLIADDSPVLPTASNIKGNMNFFSGVAPGDVVILFLAGHGVSDASGNFIFLPSDAAFNARGYPIASRTLSGAEILSVMNLPCHGLVIIDACHSGGVTNRTQAVNNNHLMRVLMQSNAYIFTASLGTEPSIEMGGDIQHGVFTYYILQGLGGSAAPTDNMVTMNQLSAYVTREVMLFTKNRQTPNGSGLGFVDIMLVKTAN